MQKFRKKPVLIEAVQFFADKYSIAKVYEFISGEKWGGTLETWHKFSNNVIDNGYRINTLEGVMTANSGDWIIKGINGEFYPCKPDIFEKTYEPAQ
jgi:hypothetical protein